jgi:hypothetical protein
VWHGGNGATDFAEFVSASSRGSSPPLHPKLASVWFAERVVLLSEKLGHKIRQANSNLSLNQYENEPLFLSAGTRHSWLVGPLRVDRHTFSPPSLRLSSSSVYNMRRVRRFGNTTVQKKCNHSIDTAANVEDTTLRDFIVNCEHAVESIRVFEPPNCANLP